MTVVHGTAHMKQTFSSFCETILDYGIPPQWTPLQYVMALQPRVSHPQCTYTVLIDCLT